MQCKKERRANRWKEQTSARPTFSWRGKLWDTLGGQWIIMESDKLAPKSHDSNPHYFREELNEPYCIPNHLLFFVFSSLTRWQFCRFRILITCFWNEEKKALCSYQKYVVSICFYNMVWFEEMPVDRCKQDSRLHEFKSELWLTHPLFSKFWKESELTKSGNLSFHELSSTQRARQNIRTPEEKRKKRKTIAPIFCGDKVRGQASFE